MDVVPSSRPHKGGPRLRKNRKIENRWGLHYEIAIQYVAFGRQCFPYMPTEPPASLSEKIVESEPLYVCKQCKDCFRFQRSFEDHNERRSWILGVWCHSCFRTVCTHITEIDSACAICIKKDNDKRSYLRTRGLTKTQKFGAVRVFYNQCQLFEHMKMHRMLSVDVADVMLMPLPTDMTNNDWSTELEIVCEALMEHTFLLRIHIMDWLRKNKVENNWWKLVNDNDDNLIRKIMDGYQGRQIFKIYEKSADDEFIDLTSDTVHNTNESSLDIGFMGTGSTNKDKNHSANMNSDKNVSEHEDNPLSNDIAFVDCGPTSKCFEPELSVSYAPKKRSTVVKRTTQEALSWRLANAARTNGKRKNVAHSLLKTKMICENTTATVVKAREKGLNKNFLRKRSSKGSTQQYKIAQSFVKETAGNSISKPIMETGVGKIQDNPININFPFPAKKIKLHKTNSDNLEQGQQTSTANCSSKLLTVQNSIDADITSIISNLPSHLISSNKKLVFCGQDSQGFITFRSKNEITSEKRSSKSMSDNSATDINTSSQKKCDPVAMKSLVKQQVTGKIVIKDGKKYLIKHLGTAMKSSENSSDSSVVTNVSKELTTEHCALMSTSTNTNETENTNIEQAAFLHNDITLLTPSPSPSELSSNSSCESYVKQTLTTKLRKAPPQLISLGAPQKNMFESISLTKEENGELYMNIKLSDYISKETSRDMCDVILKYRQEMIDEFYQLNSLELKERIDHLQHVSEEMRKVMNFISDDVLKEKLRSISTFQRILEECYHKCNNNAPQDKNDDMILNEWEAEFKKGNLSCKCPSCNKITKPKSYIAGFSKLPKDDNIYCSCYKHVCHECLSYHGTLSRFIAHQNFHKKMKPYVCPDCRCRFASPKFLEIHTWTVCFHTLKKRIFACKTCEIDGFRDMESIARHFAIMHSVTKIACEDCFKVCSSYSEYIKHHTETHSSILKQNPIRLVICRLSDEVVRCENYMSYLEKCSGIRKLTWFKCPFCPLITLENKHMTAVLNAHLRDKHLHRLSEILSKEALADIFGSEFLKSGTSEDYIDTFIANDGNLVPKIVNTRTITPEVFERGSQDKNDTWSINPDLSVPIIVTADVNLQRTKIDDKPTRLGDSLPKILEVRSMADLRATESKTTTIETVTEAKEVRSSQTSQLEVIEVEDGKEDLSHKHTKETTMESDHSKLNGKEETKKTEESDRGNNESITTCISESERSLLSETDNTGANSSTESVKIISDSESVSKTSTGGRIKVIDIRKMCKPEIEPLVAKLCDVQLENQDANNMASVPKPPPLARIPQHLLGPRKVVGSENRSRNVAKSKSLARKIANKSKWRIAINGPTDTQEECVEFLCHLCGEQINTCWSVVRTHFSEKHTDECRLAIITPQLVRLSPDFIKDGYKQVISSKKRKSDALYTSKKKRRWTPKKHPEIKDTSTSEVGLCVEQETAEDGEGNFKCKKCDQRCSDMSDLREHIATNHRLKGRYLICLECGENFVVAPSLQMHLKAFHGIEDPTNYMNQNPSYAPDINGDLETEGRTTVANQCYVCMAVFEDKAAVDKHLRVHGMAFLNRKRIEARNALKSPEKKTNVEEDKQSPVQDSPKVAVKRDKPVETILEKLNAAI